MSDPVIAAQTAAAIDQAHAAWAQVWVGLGGTVATLAAVGAALGIPIAQWRQQKMFTETTLLHSIRAIATISLKLETELLTFSPGGGLSLVRVARQRLEHTVPIVREYRMLTCLLAIMPILVRTEDNLALWTAHVQKGNGFDVDDFRLRMRTEDQRVRAVLKGYGSKRLMVKFDRFLSSQSAS